MLAMVWIEIVWHPDSIPESFFFFFFFNKLSSIAQKAALTTVADEKVCYKIKYGLIQKYIQELM